MEKNESESKPTIRQNNEIENNQVKKSNILIQSKKTKIKTRLNTKFNSKKK